MSGVCPPEATLLVSDIRLSCKAQCDIFSPHNECIFLWCVCTLDVGELSPFLHSVATSWRLPGPFSTKPEGAPCHDTTNIYILYEHTEVCSCTICIFVCVHYMYTGLVTHQDLEWWQHSEHLHQAHISADRVSSYGEYQGLKSNKPMLQLDSH